jgi:hypothetical protein
MSMTLVLVSVLTIAEASDEAALLAFKAGAGLRPGALASWNSSSSSAGGFGFCRWHGVACSRRRPTRVVALSLPSSDLAGTYALAGHREPHLPAAAQPVLQRPPRGDPRSRRRPSPASQGPRHGPHRNSISGALPANLSSASA